MNDCATDYLLAIDNGTQSVRAMVFDGKGQLIAKSKVEIEPYFSTQPGWAEQHAEYFWSSLCEACQQLWPLLDFPRERIKALSVTTQRATVIALDQQGQPLCPTISWLDQRQVKTAPKLGLLESSLISLMGAKSSVDLFHQQAEANWIAQKQPDLWRQVDKFLLLSGYHNYRLTGCYRDAVASQVGYLPFDFKQLKWAKHSDWKWRALAIKQSMLPELVSAGKTLGLVTPKAAMETGIPEGLPLIASGSDKTCEVLGSGCLDEKTASLSYGTTATFNLNTSQYKEVIPFHPAYPSLVPNYYNIEMIVQRGFWMVSWFKQQFGQLEQQAAKQQGVSVESLFENLLKETPPGAMGLMLQPYWSGAAAQSGREAKGAIVGFGEVHTRAHIYRAMIEGLTYALRESKELVEKRRGQAIDRLMVSGGGSQSDRVMQITADIFGMAVERPHTFETSGLGAAIAAAVGVGLYPDFTTAASNMTRTGQRFLPSEDNHQLYNKLYSEVYQKIYCGLKPSYKAIRAITGYPA
jgi:sugar (pentulose or hexulose) kinase